MYFTLVFWFALALPGFAIIRRFAADELQAGLMGTIALVFLATLALLSPVSIACYLFCLPTGVFAAACVAAIVWGAWEISRQKCWTELWGMFAVAACLELVIVVADAVLGGWNGAFLGGDAKVHVARIRFLLDNGFSNLDPYVQTPHFFPIYHTNILHAVYAASCKLTGVDPLGAWFVSLAWGKLLIVSGAYYLAWRVFGQRLPAWAAAMFCVGARGPIHFAIYPNQLAPFWVLPVMIGVVVRGWSGRLDRSCVFLLAGGSLVLGQLHGMYVVIALALMGPVLVGRCLWSWIKRREDRFAALGAAAVLLVGLPFVVVTKRAFHPIVLSHQAPASQEADDSESATIALGNGSLIRDPAATVNAVGGPFGLVVFFGAILIALSTQRRVEVSAMMAIMATAAALLFVPALATLLVSRAGESWVLSRLEFVFALGYTCLVAPALASKLEPHFRSRLLRSSAMLLALPAGAIWAGGEPPLNWGHWTSLAAKPAAVRQKHLRELRDLRKFLADHVPPGRTVVADPQAGMELVQAFNCHVVVSVSASNGVPDMAQRFNDLHAMLTDATPWETRRSLFQKYKCEYLFPLGVPIGWTVGHVAEHWLKRPYVLAKLQLEG